ncbi:hypothetical protein GCM10007415_25170 [Parapedobacter pyrenivorans]|uniref:Uncharacterized protein n=2 Tax=Parapedobacter pyrenivorans TaxID=1305674 RepID=A0A917MBN2_9SPHI|nr:hypothetical protein GCM10007415_25170 [Parapedobacter pyrenivorans]
MKITATQFVGFGTVVLVGLIVAAEFVFRNFMQRTYWKRPWQDLIQHELLIPAGIAALIFYNLIIGPINFFDPTPVEPSWPMLAAKRWVWAFFPALGLFYGLLWLLEYSIAPERPDSGPKRGGAWQTAVQNHVIQINYAFHSEIICQQSLNLGYDKTWREELRAYLETPPKAFRKYRYYLGNVAAIPIYPYYSLQAMVLVLNFSLTEDKLILTNAENEDGSGKASLVFRNRHESFSIPVCFADMDEVVKVMANVLTPDYELRLCRLASRHRLLKSLICLQPEEWAELTNTYGKRKMRKYFSPITNRFSSLGFLDIPWKTRSFNVLAKYEDPL